MKFLNIARAMLISAVALISQPLLAEQFVTYGDYEIHYNAFNSTFIQPDVAQNIGVQRSKRRALVNVSVLKVDGDKKIPVTANVSGSASNLIQQSQTLKFQKVDEGNAIYYLSQFGFTDDQVIRLKLDVQPDPNQAAFTVQFEQKFYEE
ncbi:DUF4426 domain-containing protein [Neptuniibacter sp.]|uniref:DUF4426 domain-containing protein n=1 Tax=Neptuniibacter sp. TaxID=1962643 RepID=UPI0026034618|nr:DUF4426 domain-containing protein [Neptuniibacter sp.]MCP4595189.1 DUF4426 domain-containing protein [Neptuniibacter sp.]